VQEDSLL